MDLKNEVLEMHKINKGKLKIETKVEVKDEQGKSVLFKEFGGVDGFPICIDEKDPDEIINIAKMTSMEQQ